jgi:hypothetical protein
MINDLLICIVIFLAWLVRANVNLLHLSVSNCQITTGSSCAVKRSRHCASTRGGTVEECYKVADLGDESSP